MILSDFIAKKEVEYTHNLIDLDDVVVFEKELGTTFGDELTQYILKYGYLAYKHIELYGINSKQKLESDMVKQTKYLHKYFNKTASCVALEDSGEGDYIVISPDDEVYEYSSEEDCITKIGKKLFEYILERFQEIDI